jgi:hypothetical protein
VSTSRKDFVETWLTEMPVGSTPTGTFEPIKYNIEDLISHGAKVIDSKTGAKKIALSQSAYYWFEDKTTGEIKIAVELEIRPQGLVIRSVGKNPKFSGEKPDAVDLYNAVLNDANRAIRLISDEVLTDAGKHIWDKLLATGHTISVYDSSAPGSSFATINTPAELDQFYDKSAGAFKKYQYVLAENGPIMLDLRSLFLGRRLRELCNIL